MSDREYTQIIDALRWNGEEYEGSLMDEEDKQLFCDAADAIERLTAEIDRKDKAIQGLLTQIESKDKEIERMRYLVRHYKAAYRTAYKPYQEARHEQS